MVPTQHNIVGDITVDRRFQFRAHFSVFVKEKRQLFCREQSLRRF